MLATLQSIARQCDGVRCDMVMLVLNEVFAKTWAAFPGNDAMPQTEFWTDAIEAVKESSPEFLFLAEAYWDLEARLQELGFNFTHDKRLYDQLTSNQPAPFRIVCCHYRRPVSRPPRTFWRTTTSAASRRCFCGRSIAPPRWWWRACPA